MSKGLWTPGPWQCPDKTGVHVRAVDGPYVADCNASAAIHWERKIANSRLIAAAPAMAEALEAVVNALSGRVHSYAALDALAKAEDALARAHGETK